MWTSHEILETLARVGPSPAWAFAAWHLPPVVLPMPGPPDSGPAGTAPR